MLRPSQCSQLEAISKSVEYLLATAATGTEVSRNISLLTKLFESQQNINTLLSGSKLFDWARAESWGHLSTTRLRRDIASMLADFQNNRSSVCHVDLESLGSAVVTEDPSEMTALAETTKTELADTLTFAHVLSKNLPRSDNATLASYAPPERSLRQLSAKLHCLYGVSIDCVRKDTTASPRYSLRSDTAPIHPYARSLVYDLRQHTDHTLWGPFLDDGSQNVDWEKVEAIMIILDHNMKKSTEAQHLYEGLVEVQSKPFVGASPKSFISPPSTIPMEPSLPLEAQDPYNITGTWMRVVCFLDYTELYDFNFDGDTIPDDEPRRPIVTDEAVRLITMHLRVTKIEAPGEEDGQDLPVVHFKGISSSLRPSFDPNANSKTRGQ